jgi:hypothetical protein
LPERAADHDRGVPKTTHQTTFAADQFTATKFTSAEEKAKAATRLVRFIERDFPRSAWNRPLYNSLYLHLFGHIAHYDAAGFWSEWFSTTANQLRWLEYAADYPLNGSPDHTWVDVEQAVQSWIKERDLIGRYAQRVADGE